MNLQQLSRLRAMLDPKSAWDLNDSDRRAISAAIEGMPNPRLVEALEAVLMFHSGSPWDSEKQLAWGNLTGHTAATTRGLCDFIRGRLAEPFDSTMTKLVAT